MDTSVAANTEIPQDRILKISLADKTADWL
jgi:hypothetical protein